MAEIQQLIFDILTRDRASDGLSRIGRSASDAAGNTDTLNRRLDELARKTAKARVELQGDKDAQARLDKIDAKLLSLDRRSANPNISIEGIARATAELSALDLELDKVGGKGGSAETATAAVGQSGLAGPAGIGALIAAGVALSPIIATLGTGLAGFGLAAYGVAKPIEDAAKKTGGLQANLSMLDAEQRKVAEGILGLGKQFDQFGNDLKPVVLKDFNAGLHLASGLLHDVEPVAAATGKALGGLIGQIDAEFRSNNWQNFFQFMARTAGPDMKLLGGAFVSLTSDLPPLLEALQPVASALLQVITYTGDAVRAAELASTNFQDLGKASQKSGDGFNAVTTGAQAAIPGLGYVARLGREVGSGLDILYGNSKSAGSGLHDVGQNAQQAAGKVFNLKQNVTALAAAESKSLDTQLAYSNSLVTSANDAVALRKALKASGDQVGLHTAAERASFSAANTYISDLEQTAKQSWASGHGTDGAIAAISRGLPILEQAKSKSKAYWEEVRTLKGWLDKLTAEKQIQEVIKLTGSGQWSFGAGSQYLHGLTGQHAAGGAAAGMLVRGGTPGRDSVLIKAMPGEVVVPTGLVNAGAVDHLRGRIPGFAQGGLVPSYSGSVSGMTGWGQSDWLATIQSAISSFVSAGKQMQTAPVLGIGGPVSGSAAQAQRYAASVLGAYGWGSSQMSPLIALWNRESGWNRFAQNPSSGAYGIPQALPPTKMPFAAQAAGGSSMAAQIGWGLSYIAGRYGSPSGAWGHEVAFGWYDQGGYLPPGMSLAYNGTGRPERVGGGGNVYITINVPPTVNPRDAGRQVADLLKAHVKGGGTIYPAGVTPR